jgi:hypothetical protein
MVLAPELAPAAEAEAACDAIDDDAFAKTPEAAATVVDAVTDDSGAEAAGTWPAAFGGDVTATAAELPVNKALAFDKLIAPGVTCLPSR